MRTILALLIVAAATAPARAETITGTFTFTDFDGAPTPIANATVEVWRNVPHPPFGWFSWEMDMTAFTDASGHLSAFVPYVGNGVQTQLRVYATNPAVVVKHQDEPWQPFYAVPPQTFNTSSAADSFDFTTRFTNSFDTSHFNIAQAIQTAKAYADARRDPRETDTIDQMAVDVQFPGANTFYDPNVHEIRLSIDLAMDDFTVIHEYGHFLEQRISSFQGIASWHDGCQFLSSAPPFGIDISNPGMAWMEGFADYFSQAVARVNTSGPMRVTGNQTGTISRGAIETSPCSTSEPEKTEDNVAGALWDLVDVSPSEPTDRFCSRGFDTDTIIFQIVDHELGQIGGNPSIQDFLDAWVARGYDVPPLQSTWGSLIGHLTIPAHVPHYDPRSQADYAIWRPGTGTWWVLWQDQHADVTQWGMQGDVPVPADYDGDHNTDLAVWRPSDGNWYVILSGSGGITHVTQWGQQGDIPLPADYDGDGEIDIAVYRPSTGMVYVKDDNCGFDLTINVGAGTPVVGQFDADGKADAGVFDSATGTFRIQSTALGLIQQQMPTFSAAALADYDGDGRTDFAVFSVFSGQWTIINSASGQVSSFVFGTPHFTGIKGQRVYANAVPANYNGTGTAVPAVWYSDTGTWSVRESDGSVVSQQWGQAGDVPVPR